MVSSSSTRLTSNEDPSVTPGSVESVTVTVKVPATDSGSVNVLDLGQEMVSSAAAHHNKHTRILHINKNCLSLTV